MADRWSNPSGSLGIQRFRVWPLGTDSYDHAELTSNFDKIDAIIGIPAVGDWPPTQGTNGGIYAEVLAAKAAATLNAIPIGAMIPWFRPDATVPLPTGFVLADGSTVTKPNHGFTTIAGSIVVPDMRNKFVLGADYNFAVGQAGAAAGTANVEAAAGAPGPQGTAGENQHTLTLAEIPAHTHSYDKLAQFANAFPSGNVTNYGTNAVSTPQTGSAGGGGAHENRPRSVGLVWIARVK